MHLGFCERSGTPSDGRVFLLTTPQCYIVNPPLAFRAAWALVRPMLDEKTRNKIKARWVTPTLGSPHPLIACALDSRIPIV